MEFPETTILLHPSYRIYAKAKLAKRFKYQQYFYVAQLKKLLLFMTLEAKAKALALYYSVLQTLVNG